MRSRDRDGMTMCQNDKTGLDVAHETAFYRCRRFMVMAVQCGCESYINNVLTDAKPVFAAAEDGAEQRLGCHNV